MAEAQLVIAPDVTPTRISAQEYEEKYAHDFYEWVDGVLIKMSPVSVKHNLITLYLAPLFQEYLGRTAHGELRVAPFLMEVPTINSKREPDLQIILKTNPGTLTETKMLGPADICIEVVSKESVQRDYGEKLVEYEQGGVGEYWILDPLRHVSHFYRLSADGHYISCLPNENGNYRTPLLPGFVLHVPTLWQDRLPLPGEIVQAVQAMLQSSQEP